MLNIFTNNRLTSSSKSLYDISKHPWFVSRSRIILFLVLLIIIAFYYESKKFLHEEWENQRPAYNVETEYWTLFFAGGMKSKLLNQRDWSTNNLIVKYLDSLSEDAYKSAKNKIPDTDGEILLFEYMYKIGNFIPKKEEALERIGKDIFYLFTELLDPNLEIKNQFMKTEFRYFALDRLKLGMIRMFNLFDIKEEKSVEQNFIDKIDIFLSSNTGKLLYQRGYKSESQDQLSISMHLGLFEMLRPFIFSIKEDKIFALNYSCKNIIKNQNLKKFSKIISKLINEILPKYHNNINSYSQNMKDYINYVSKRVTTSETDANFVLKTKCKITL